MQRRHTKSVIKANTRGLALGTRNQQKFVQRYIKQKHLQYLKRWQKKLELEHCVFILRAKKATKRVPLASIQKVDRTLFIIWLTPKTLASTDWRDSIVHELLHALFWDNKRADKVTDIGEERIIILISSLLARS